MLQPTRPLAHDAADTLGRLPIAEAPTTPLVERPPPTGPRPVRRRAVRGFDLLMATVTFRPYGDRLLSPAGAGWLLIVTVLVLIMALAEAVAWGRMMSQLSEGPWMPLVGFAAGIAVFVIVWGIDATLMTLDVGAPEVERRLYGRDKGGLGARLNLLGGYLLRIGIVSASLWLTAPQLADMLFTTDIEHLVDLERQALVEPVRRDLENRDAEREAALRAQLWQDRNLLEDELAGRSSGRRGYGPIARTIEGRIASAEAELQQITTTRATQLEALRQAVADDDAAVLESQWGLVLPSDSAAERRKALEQLSADPSFAAAERSIQGFLILIFVSLFAAKLFQPRAIKIYLSGPLQDEYCRYLAGEFDAWLPEGERSANAHTMTPYRFEDLVLNVLPEVRKADLHRRERQLRREHLALQLADIESVDADLQRRLTRARNREADLHDQLSDQLRDAADHRDRVDRLTRDASLQRSAYEEANAMTQGADVVALARSRATLRDAWQTTQRELHAAAADLRSAERLAQRTTQAHAALAREVEVLEAQLELSAGARQAHRDETLRVSVP